MLGIQRVKKPLDPTTKITIFTKAKFKTWLNEKIADKYMDDVVDLVETIRKTTKLLNKLNKWYAEIEGGNFDTIQKFKELKSKIGELGYIEEDN